MSLGVLGRGLRLVMTSAITERFGSLLSFLSINPPPNPPIHTKSPSPRLLPAAKPLSISPPPPTLPPRARHRPRGKQLSLAEARGSMKHSSSPRRNDISDTEKMKLKNHHQLMRTMVKLEDEDDEIRKSSALAQSFIRMNKALKEIRTTAASKLPKIAPAKQVTISDFSLRPQEAHMVVGEMDRGQWLRRRGVETEGTGLKGLISFVKRLFDTLDEEGVGSLEYAAFVSDLLGLGVAQNWDWASKALETLQISHIKVYKNEFISALKRDPHHWFIYHILERESTHSQAPKVPLPQGTSAALLLARSSQSFSSSCLTLNHLFACLTTLEKWWKELDPHSIAWAPVTRVADLLVSKEIVGNKYEGRNLLEAVKPLGDERSIQKDHFERVFAPAILLGGLHLLDMELRSGEFAGNTVPFKVKLATYRRKLLLAGVVSTTSQKEPSPGQVLVQALSSLRKEGEGVPGSLRSSMEGQDALNLTRLDMDPFLSGKSHPPLHKKRSRSEIRSTAESTKHPIHGKVFFPSLSHIPRPREVQLGRENYLLAKLTRAVDFTQADEQLNTYY